MSVTIRAVDLDTEHEELLAVLERNLTDLPHSRRFKWMYRDNPLGPAWSWFACDGATGQAVGVASVFRRAMWLGRRMMVCGQVGDFAIDAGHRSLGPAVMLQRATFEPVDRGSLTLCYDCPPHDRGMSTFRRIGMEANASLARHAKLLRANRKIEGRIGEGPVARALAPVGNALIWLRDGDVPRPNGLEIIRHPGRFGGEFTDLDERVRSRDVIRGRRSAEDLNWRYRDNPLHEYGVLAARRRGELIGFVILSGAGRDATLVDLFGEFRPGDALGLLDAAADEARAAGAETLHATVSDGSHLVADLGRAGFSRREAGPHVVAYTAPGSEDRGQLERPLTWDLTHQDIMA